MMAVNFLIENTSSNSLNICKYTWHTALECHKGELFLKVLHTCSEQRPPQAEGVFHILGLRV